MVMWHSAGDGLSPVAALGDAEHLTKRKSVRVLQHRVVGGEDRHRAVGVAVGLASDSDRVSPDLSVWKRHFGKY